MKKKGKREMRSMTAPHGGVEARPANPTMTWVKEGLALAWVRRPAHENPPQGSVCLSELRIRRKKRSPGTFCKSHKSEVLQQESSDKVWNELAKYREMYEELKSKWVQLDEERDSLRAQCFYQQTLLVEHERENEETNKDIEEKMSAIASVGTFGTEITDKKVKEMEDIIKKLTEDNKSHLQHIGILTARSTSLQNALEKSKSELRREKSRKSVKIVDAQTMTEKSSTSTTPLPPVLTVDSSAQTLTSALVHCGVQTESKRRFSNPSLFKSPGVENRCISFHGHKRTYSDGDQFACCCNTAKRRMAKCVTFSFKEQYDESQRKLQTRPSHTRGSSSRVIPLIPSMMNSFGKSNSGCGGGGGEVKVHKCIWQEKVLELQMRVKSLHKQVVLATTSKQIFTQRLEEENAVRIKAEHVLCDSVKKHQVAKQKLGVQKNEINKLKNEIQELQTELYSLEEKTKKHSDTDWKRMESQQRELQDKCTSLSQVVRNLEEAASLKAIEISRAMDRSAKLERDLKQKRAVIDHWHQKEADSKLLLSDKEAKMAQLTADVTSLKKVIEGDKLKVKYLQLQVSKAIKEKKESEECLEAINKEMEKLRHRCETYERTKKVMDQSKAKLEKTMKAQESTHQAEVDWMQEMCRSLKEVETEFENFVLCLADVIIEIFTVKQLKANESVYEHNQETDALAGRVREIAKTALNLSEAELRDFFDDEASVENVISEAERRKHESFRKVIEKKMNSDPKVPFGEDLVKCFADYVAANIL